MMLPKDVTVLAWAPQPFIIRNDTDLNLLRPTKGVLNLLQGPRFPRRIIELTPTGILVVD